MAEAERSEENGGLEPCPDAGSWVKEKEAEEKQEAWRPGAPPTQRSTMKWCTVTNDGYRTRVHRAAKHGAVGEADKRAVAERLGQRPTEGGWRQDGIISSKLGGEMRQSWLRGTWEKTGGFGWSF